MIYNNPATPTPTQPTGDPLPPTLNPESYAAELMSPGSIGAANHTDNTPPADWDPSKETWYQYLYRVHSWGVQLPSTPKIRGYSAPPPVIIYTRTGTYWSVETRLQGAVSALAASPLTQGWTDTAMSKFLFDIATDQAAFLGFSDPGTGEIPALVSKYTAIYRVAVTPA